MTTAAAWAPERERESMAHGFVVMVETARAVGPQWLLEAIGPPGRLCDFAVQAMLTEAGVRALDNPRVLAGIDWWRGEFAGAGSQLSDAQREELDAAIELAGADACADRYWLALLALAWFTEFGADEIREELRREQAGESD